MFLGSIARFISRLGFKLATGRVKFRRVALTRPGSVRPSGDLRRKRTSPRVRPMSTFGERLRAARVNMALTQADAARLAGVTARSWRAWEKDRQSPGLARLAAVAAGLGVTLASLVPDASTGRPGAGAPLRTGAVARAGA